MRSWTYNANPSAPFPDTHVWVRRATYAFQRLAGFLFARALRYDALGEVISFGFITLEWFLGRIYTSGNVDQQGVRERRVS